MDEVMRLASENGVLIFTKSSCCMCYSVIILLRGHEVIPTVYEINHNPEDREIMKYLQNLARSCNNRAKCVPMVFIGGTFIGSTDEVMSLHLNGSLVRLLQPYQQLPPLPPPPPGCPGEQP